MCLFELHINHSSLSTQVRLCTFVLNNYLWKNRGHLWLFAWKFPPFWFLPVNNLMTFLFFHDKTLYILTDYARKIVDLHAKRAWSRWVHLTFYQTKALPLPTVFLLLCEFIEGKTTTMTRLKIFLTIAFLYAVVPGAWAQYSGWSGTEADPYQISSADDWNTLCANVNNGTSTYSGKFFK